MTIKLESNTSLPTYRRNQDMRGFLEALRDMKTGQSFVYKLSSYNRNMIRAAETLLKREYVSRSIDGNGTHRVYRTK